MSEGFPLDVGRHRPNNRIVRIPFWTDKVLQWILVFLNTSLRNDFEAGWSCDLASLNIPSSVRPYWIEFDTV